MGSIMKKIFEKAAKKLGYKVTGSLKQNSDLEKNRKYHSLRVLLFIIIFISFIGSGALLGFTLVTIKTIKPIIYDDSFKARQLLILGLMEKNNLIAKDEYHWAVNENIQSHIRQAILEKYSVPQNAPLEDKKYIKMDSHESCQ